jgi:hypothetical protein
MLSEWLKRDTEASWDKLAGALSVIGENVVAANVRSRFMKAGAAGATPGPVADASNEDNQTCKPLYFHTHLTFIHLLPFLAHVNSLLSRIACQPHPCT